jgi:hypothetical protein
MKTMTRHDVSLLIFSVVLFTSCQKNNDNPPPPVSGERYKNEIFSNVTITKDIKYGQARNFQGQMEDLYLDLYQPAGDVEVNRPMVIALHGGSFINGDKTDSNWPIFCQAFAKRGYVTASINYRLGIAAPNTPKTALEAIWRAQQDLRAAIRFARANSSTYKINPNKIFIMGNSAGGATCMNVGYVDSYEVPAEIDQTTWGNIEGNSGSPGYSSIANAVISLWGNIGDTSWISTNNIPVGLVHSRLDPVAPYVSGFNQPTATNSYGGFSINQRAKNLNVKTELKTYNYQGHDRGLDDLVYLDSTITFSSNFLYQFAK